MNISSVIKTKDLTFLVVGDPMIDRYWQAQTSRISPEAPIPVYEVLTKTDIFGGAANVEACLVALGASTINLWAGNQADYQGPIKNRLMVSDVQVCRWDENDWCPANKLPEDGLHFDAVVVGDYLKGGFSNAWCWWLVEKCRVPVFVDTKGDPSWMRALMVPYVAFPNKKEYLQYTKAYNSLELVVLKEGAAGLTLMSRGETWAHFPALASKVVSVNGAGDTVIAAFAYCMMMHGWDITFARKPAKFANAAAGVVVEKPLTATARVEEIFTKLHEDPRRYL